MEREKKKLVNVNMADGFMLAMSLCISSFLPVLRVNLFFFNLTNRKPQKFDKSGTNFLERYKILHFFECETHIPLNLCDNVLFILRFWTSTITK